AAGPARQAVPGTSGSSPARMAALRHAQTRQARLVQVEADAEQGEEPEEYREQRGERTLDKADGYVSTGPCHHDADDHIDNEDDADRPSEHRSALPSPRRG